jgi:ribokinase
MTFDFVAVGDTVVDDFIRLTDATELTDHSVRELCVRFGDKVPFESSTKVYGVGNSANAAVCAARLGFSSQMVAVIGKDMNGDKIVENFTKEGVDTTYVHQQDGAPTNYHYVLWYGDERTILVNHFAYEYHFPMDLPEPKMLYLSSLAAAAEKYHDEIADYLEAHPNIFFTFQPGTFQMKLGKERLARLYKRANLFVVNKEEAQRILGLPVGTDDVPMLMQKLHELGPKVVLVSDDRNGAYGLENGESFHLPMYEDPKPPINRTGAGDSFTSTTTLYYATGTPLKEAMLRGMINAAYVVQGVGAQMGLLTKEKLDELYAAIAH